jgi:hypothetical protein
LKRRELYHAYVTKLQKIGVDASTVLSPNSFTVAKKNTVNEQKSNIIQFYPRKNELTVRCKRYFYFIFFFLEY